MSIDIIESHCHSCGLYIPVPKSYAGGKGQCPRCKTIVRVPVGLREDNPQYQLGMRYIAMPAALNLKKKALAVSSGHGPATRFLCSGCDNTFESLKVFDASHKRCPRCGNDAKAMVQAVRFPRVVSGAHAQILKQTDPAEEGVYIPEAMPAEDD